MYAVPMTYRSVPLGTDKNGTAALGESCTIHCNSERERES